MSIGLRVTARQRDTADAVTLTPGEMTTISQSASFARSIALLQRRGSFGPHAVLLSHTVKLPV